jgi:hypothetical protein
MRGYGRIALQFWTGSTGKRLRKNKDARILAAYLVTGSNANMLGLYYLPLPLILHETGLTEKEVKNAFEFLSEEGYASYHQDTEFVYVPTMVYWQVGYLKETDNQIRSVNNAYKALPDNPFLGDFFDTHHEGLRLTSRKAWQGVGKGSRRGRQPLGKGCISCSCSWSFSISFS